MSSLEMNSMSIPINTNTDISTNLDVNTNSINETKNSEDNLNLNSNPNKRKLNLNEESNKKEKTISLDNVNNNNMHSCNNHSESKLESKLESITHCYYEIKSLADIQVKYLSHTFHLHAQILGTGSLYFKDLIEKNLGKLESLDLDTFINPLTDKIIKAEHLKEFFDCVYNESYLKEINNFINRDEKNVFISFRCSFLDLIYLSDYFDVKKAQKIFKTIFNDYCTKESSNKTNLWIYLYLAQVYLWEEIKEEIIENIYCNFEFLTTDEDALIEYEKYKSKIFISTQEKIIYRQMAYELTNSIINDEQCKKCFKERYYDENHDNIIGIIESVLPKLKYVNMLPLIGKQ